MKTIFFFFFLLTISVPAWSQNSYLQSTIVAEDTTLQRHNGQIYWKLYQGVKDAIVESTLPEGNARKTVKYPILSREYNGYEATFHVKKGASEEFDIVFHTGDQTVTYIFNDKTVIYRGNAVRFTLHD